MANVGGLYLGLEMVTSADEFADKIIKEMYGVLNKKLKSASFRTSLTRGTKTILEENLRKQDTFVDMVAEDGKLRNQLGVVDSVSAMESLVNTWVASTQVTFGAPRIVGHEIRGSIFTIRAIDASYKDVLSETWAWYTTEKDKVIPWLDWLLLHGQEILVMGYVSKKVKRYTPASRTDTNVIMVQTKGLGWGIPEQYAGVSGNNFATKAVASAAPEILAMMESETRRRI